MHHGVIFFIMFKLVLFYKKLKVREKTHQSCVSCTNKFFWVVDHVTYVKELLDSSLSIL